MKQCMFVIVAILWSFLCWSVAKSKLFSVLHMECVCLYMCQAESLWITCGVDGDQHVTQGENTLFLATQWSGGIISLLVGENGFVTVCICCDDWGEIFMKQSVNKLTGCRSCRDYQSLEKCRVTSTFLVKLQNAGVAGIIIIQLVTPVPFIMFCLFSVI